MHAHARAPWLFGVLVACGASATATRPAHSPTTPTAKASAAASSLAPALRGLRVVGNHLVDGDAEGGDGGGVAAHPVRLLGVNHSGTEYACVQGLGIFEGPPGRAGDPDALALPILAWGANTVRIPLNESCWLGTGGADPHVSGRTYQDAIAGLVTGLRARGLYVIVELHWSAPGASLATGQQPMADADHSIDFWRSVASRFALDRGVVFDLFNEPFLDLQASDTEPDPWACLRDGCTVTGKNSVGRYRTAGTQAMLDAVRAAGARNVVLVPGLGYSSDLSQWLAHAPRDPLGQVAASLHLYNFNGCDAGPGDRSACFAARYDTVIAAAPLVAGEIGENDCDHRFIDDFMRWADVRGVSYLGWTWNTWDCAKGPALIRSYDGTPTAFGIGLRDHLLGLRASVH